MQPTMSMCVNKDHYNEMMVEWQQEEINKLKKQISKRNKVINYCIGQIQDSSKLKYIGTITNKMDD